MTPKESLVRDLARLVVWYPFRYLLRVLPVSLSIALLRTMGFIHSILARNRVTQLESNLKSLSDEELRYAERRKIVRAYLMNHYVDRLQIFLFPKWQASYATRRFIMIQGERHIETALQQGRGAILVHPHFGPLHLMLYPLADRGFPLLQIGYPTAKNLSAIGRHVAFRLRLAYESMLPATIHPADRFIRPVFRHLAANGVVLVTGDGAGGGDLIGSTVTVPFLDAWMAVPEGPFKLARLTGAAIMPGFIIPERTGYYKLVIGRPISVSGEDEDQAVKAAVNLFAQYLQSYIHRFPALWHFWDEWEQGKRKKERPDSHPPYPS